MPFRRKQVYIDPENERKIRKLARATGLSEAEHIRRAIASYVADFPGTDSEPDPLLAMIGICDREEGPRDAAARHDAYLYGRKR